MLHADSLSTSSAPWRPRRRSRGKKQPSDTDSRPLPVSAGRRTTSRLRNAQVVGSLCVSGADAEGASIVDPAMIYASAAIRLLDATIAPFSAAGEAFARRYLSYGAMQCFWRVLLEEYAATVGGFRPDLLDELLRRGDALPLTLGALPVRFAGPDNRTDSSPVAVRC